MEEERDLIRQGERTVDNLKRLFAFVFAISFGVIGTGAIEKLSPELTDAAAPPPSFGTWFVNAEMLTVFVITAGVFFHQGTKFLDNRYARQPLIGAHPFGFAWDYLTLVVTMIPFFFMAQAFRPSVTHSVGYTWFFGFYVLLLGSGLILLYLAAIRHSGFIRNHVFGETIAADELRREGTLRIYWLLMNSLILLLMLVIFTWYIEQGDLCPTSTRHAGLPSFLLRFGALALLRDYLDYRYAWRFLYPLRRGTAEALDRWPLTSIRDARRPWLWLLPAILFSLAAFGIAYSLHFWDLGRWVAACRP